MRLFSKEEVMSLQEHVRIINKQYKNKTQDGQYGKKIKALNDINKIISSKFR